MAQPPSGPPVNTVPHHTLATSPVRSNPSFGRRSELPLHLINLIVSYVDDVADIARLTRACRLLYYMALPRLYERVTLRSYSELRYSDGRPEGYGGGSPFAMGLNALVSRPVADYVHEFRLVGEWKEQDLEDYSKGRVPDNSMMLNIALRAAIDRMKQLKVFAWELNTKPMQTVYQGIMGKPSITSFTLRCPTTRVPRPTVLIPPLPNLKSLTVYDIDPLCYPDDFSLLLVAAKKLEELVLHWNPRMRQNGEESVNLMNYFGRCLAARHSVPVKRFALHNLYSRNMGGFEDCFDADTLVEVTLINSMGSQDPLNVFLDETWRINAGHRIPKGLKMMRIDTVDRGHVEMLGRFEGIERLYLISRRPKSKESSAIGTPSTPFTPGTSASNGHVSEEQCKGIAGDYLAAIQHNHKSMRHLLLADMWLLNDDTVVRLAQACPNLEQLGFAAQVPEFSKLRRAIGSLPKLFVLRLLVRPGNAFEELIYHDEEGAHEFVFGQEMWRPEYKNLQWVGLGDLVYKLGGVVNKGKRRASKMDADDISSIGPMRIVKRVDKDAVKDIEIWKYDTTEFIPGLL